LEKIVSPWRSDSCYTPRLFPGRTSVRVRVGPPSVRGTSVKQDWRAWLTQEKDDVYRSLVLQLDSSYNMFSVSLNEAIELRQRGRLAKSLQLLGVVTGLCKLLTVPLAGLLRALSGHAKHNGTIPNAAPLDPENFHGQKAQRLARLSSLLNRILLSHRSQFLHKVATLAEMVEDLEKDFCEAATDLSEGTAADPRSQWDEVDAGHYDLNTCLREAIVLLKSFLVALPEDQLKAFEQTVREQTSARVIEPPLHQRVLRHRRMTAIAGE
jgi:hypothetical protein